MSNKHCNNCIIIFAVLCLLQGMMLPTIAQPSKTSTYKIKFGNVEKNIEFIDRSNAKYVSASLFANLFDIGFFNNKEKKKAELSFKTHSIKLSANSTFITIIDNNSSESTVFQIGLPIIIEDNSIYFSFEQIKKYLEKCAEIIPNGQKDNETKQITKEETKKTDEENSKTGSEEKTKKPLNFGNSVNLLKVEERANGVVIIIGFAKGLPKVSHKNEKGVIIIKLGAVNIDSKYEKSFTKGAVRKIESGDYEGGNLLEITPSKDFESYEVTQDKDEEQISVNVRTKVFQKSENTPSNKTRWVFDTIIIDAGHGGHDAGAVGYKGLKEKDVNLAVALKFGALIKENLKGVNVIFTRSNDSFVELYKRGKIANERGGKLFISLHCNSVPDKDASATGFEVYLLRPGKTDDAIKIAERENSVIKYEENPDKYQKLTDENFILVSMQHSTYMHYSEKFAEIVNTNFSVNLPIKSRGIKQAGFLVLVGASMPSVLIELGFVTGKEDSKMLSTDSGQTKLAQSLLEAVKSYRHFYDEMMAKEN